jgi:hypothetical protein
MKLSTIQRFFGLQATPVGANLMNLSVAQVVSITRGTSALIDEELYGKLLARISNDLNGPAPIDAQSAPLPTFPLFSGTLSAERERVIRYFVVNGCPAGTLLPHDQDSLLVQGFCYPLDLTDPANPRMLDGDMLSMDSLWSAKAKNMTNAVLASTDPEPFYGIVVLAIFPMPVNPVIINPDSVNL